MTQANFDKCLTWVLQSEGGFVDDPRDPGGATNFGITQRVYSAWRATTKQRPQAVKYITNKEVASIYDAQYWLKSYADTLPTGVDYSVFDAAVNSGVVQSIKWLQLALGINADGFIGLVTTQAISKIRNPQVVITRINQNRLGFLQQLRTWQFFDRGWKKRVQLVNSRSMAMAGKTEG